MLFHTPTAVEVSEKFQFICSRNFVRSAII